MTGNGHVLISLALALGTGSIALDQPPLRPCGPDRGAAYASAECGAIRVWENRRTKQGRQIDIAFARWRAHAQPAAGAVFLLAGGPGGSGSSVAFSADGWAQPLRATHDLVVVDQRGTWFSHALHCARTTESAPASGFGHIFDPGWVRQCRSFLETTADLRQYTTAMAADDLDDVRAALGYERISLYGSSYGTRLAQAYMRQYATRTRSVVLDGVLPFDRQVPLTYAATAQQALDRVFEDCAARPACRKAHPDLRGAFARVLVRFEKGPIASSVSRPGGSPVRVEMSRGDFGYAVRGILYSPNLTRSLPDWIGRAASAGDLSPFAQEYWERQLAFSRTFATGLHFSVLCAEDVPFFDEAAIAAATAGTFLGRYVIDEYRNACALWPAAEVPADFRRPVSSSIPTLLLSGHFDPVTPPAFAEQVAKALSVSRHLVSRPSGHGSVGACPRGAALFVLREGTLTGMPDACGNSR